MTLTDIYNRDLPLLREMGANTIRLWGWDNNADHTDFLDKAYNNGIDPIYVIATFWMDPSKYPDISSPATRAQIKADFRAMVAAHKDHPAILMWSIGNELNAPWMYGDNLKDLFSLIDEMAQEAHDEEGSNYHPVITPLLDRELIHTIAAYEPYMFHLDAWGANVYRGPSFGSLFNDYSQVSNKPLVILEYGIDAYDSINGDEYEYIEAPYQALYAESLWQEIIANLGIVAGGAIMAYSDEWWRGKHSEKGGGCPEADPAFHSPCGYPDVSHTDEYTNEEWWGIMRPKDSGLDPDIMEPRAVYYTLQSLWTSPPLQESQSGLSFRFSQTAIATCPSIINFGETIQCSINTAGEKDAYTFSASAGDVVTIRMRTSSGSLWPSLELYDPTGKLITSNQGGSSTQIDATLSTSGTYIIIASDGFNGTFTSSYELSLLYIGFQASSITPNKGGNTGVVTTAITGAKFQTGASVKLTGEGYPDINAIEVTVTDSSHITASFDLTGKTSDTYDVVVTHPDGQSATLPKAFTIEEGGSAKLWVDIVGSKRIRAGREEAYYIRYGNSGSIDTYDVIISIALPAGITYTVDLPRPEIEGLDWNKVPTGFERNSQVIIPLWVYKMPSNTTSQIKLRLKATSTSRDQQNTLPIDVEIRQAPQSSFSKTGSIDQIDNSESFILIQKYLADYLVKNGYPVSSQSSLY